MRIQKMIKNTKIKVKQKISRTKNFKIGVIIIFAILFVIGLIPKISRLIITNNETKSGDYTALTETPTIQNGIPNLELSGELKPYLHTEIFSRVNGLIRSRKVELGEKVQKGQVLATIDTPDLDEEAQSASAELNSAQKHLIE